MTLKEAFPEVAAPPKTHVAQPVLLPQPDPIVEVARHARALISDYEHWTVGAQHRISVEEITEGVFIKRKIKVEVDRWCLLGAFEQARRSLGLQSSAPYRELTLFMGESPVVFNDSAGRRTPEHHERVLRRLDAFIASRERLTTTT